MPPVEQAIPPFIRTEPAPHRQVFPGGIRMAVSTHNLTVQIHVNQGLNHLHGGWDNEAARHFAFAMRLDPDCLMAHWGMVMSLLSSSLETDPARTAAIARLIHLIEAGRGTDLERGYAYGLLKYFEEGPQGASIAFRKVADKFPREMQAAIFSALFHRGGYDESGAPTADQESAEKTLLSLIERHPESTAPINALLLIRAEAPSLSNSIPTARKLCQMAPDYPPYFHLLGHYEWRSGNHREAASAFAKATTQYRNWMTAENTTIADCPDWIRSECYRIIALASQEEYDIALAAASQVASLPIPENRRLSQASRSLWWDAKTLPARIGMRINTKESLTRALNSLPSTDVTRDIREQTLAYWWIDGLRLAIDGKLQLVNGDIDQARNVADAITLHGEAMAQTQTLAIAKRDRSSWLRAFRALEVLASELRGDIALAGPPQLRETAFNWFTAAADRQLPEPMLMPPMILTPMAARIGRFHLQAGRPQQAIEAFERALTLFPNDPSTSRDLAIAKEPQGRDAPPGRPRN